MRDLRVLVCGGRNFNSREVVFSALAALHAERPISWIIEGGASGVDRLAYAWALQEGLQHRTYRADWSTHGRAAGPIRNATMLADGDPDLVLAFPGGRGTEDMVRRAVAAGVPVRRVP